jgi:proline iminopeptidase
MLTHAPSYPHAPESGTISQPLLHRLWTHTGTRIAAATGASVTTALLAAVLMPRGPVTAPQALVLMALGLLTGIAAGFILRSRWAMLLTPVIFVAAFELGRLGETGATVDTPNMTTTFGIIAFLAGRGVTFALAIAPMLLGVLWGKALAASVAGDTPHHRGTGFAIRRGLAGLATMAMMGLAAWIALPPSVPPVLGADGREVAGSVSELVRVEIGGNQQWVELRGADPDNPVLLYISGGPGQSDLALARALLAPLETDVTIALWDQRGNGLSYASFDRDSMTLDRVIADAIEVTDYLRARFDEEKIYVLGESWGSTLAVLAAQERPDLFHAVIGSGQMVSQLETDKLIYNDLLAWAEQNDTRLAEQLRGFGPPPYSDVWAYGVVVANYERIESDYDPPQAAIDRLEAADVGFWGIGGSEYTPINKTNIFRGLVDTADVLYPQLQGIDFRTDVPSLAVPIYIFDGEHELRGRRDLLLEWVDMLQAPEVQVFTFADGGHSVALEHGDDLHRILVETIIPATYPAP